MTSPIERFLDDSLKEFEKHLKSEGIAGAREQRMRGAREFAVFLLGRPHKKGEITKGKIG